MGCKLSLEEALSQLSTWELTNDGREAIFITGSIFLISLALVGLAYRTKIVRSTPKQEEEE